MPTFQQIYSNYNKALEKNLIGPDESLSDYAKKALFVTGDPSYKSVAEGGSVGNWVRQRSADLTNLVNSGPADEWLGAGTQWLGDRFGIDQKVSRSVGESLPRMAVDFLPMAVGAGLAPFTGGSSLALAGLGATSALSAASAYEQEGKLSDAVIGAAAPYVGGKLSEIGGRAALNLVPKSQVLQRLGFTGGTKVTGRALTAAEESAMMARRGVTESVAKGTTKSFTELDKPLDKLLHYVGGEALANVGFTGLDIAQQGSQAVFNRDYLFSNLVSNIPFAAADLAGSFANRPVGEIKYDLPEAKPVYASPGEERAIYAASQFKDLESPEALRAYRQKYGLDIADISLKTEELKMALNAKESGLRNNDANFISRWNNYVSTTPEAQSAGFKPITRGGAFGSEILGMKEVLGMPDLPIMGKKIVEDYKNEKQKLYSSVTNVVKNLGQRVDTVESLKRGVMELGLDEFLKTPVEERDYAKALEGSWLSLDGVDLVRDIHRKEAGLEPLRPELYNEFVELFKGKPASFTPDKHMELLVAASLARGQTPKFDFAKKKAQQAVKEGQADEVVVEEALKGMTEENKAVLESFKQPVQELSADWQVKLESLKNTRLNLEQELIKAQVAGEIADEKLKTARQNDLVQQLKEADERYLAYQKLIKQAANVVESSAELPTLKEGFVRVVHMSQPNVRERIMTNGLDYEKFGLLSSTARFWSKGKDVEYDIPGDPRFAGEDAYVFDIPADSLKLHNDVTKSPGRIEPKYLVGIVKGTKSKALAKQPVALKDAQSGLFDLGQTSDGDLRRGLTMKLGSKTGVIPEDFQSGLTKAGDAAQVDLIKNLAKKPVQEKTSQQQFQDALNAEDTTATVDETPWFQAPAPQVIERLLTSVNGVLNRMRRAENRNAYAAIPADTTVKLFREELKALSVEKKRELAKQAQKELGYKVNVTELDAALVDMLDIKEQAVNVEAVMDKPLDELQVEVAKKEEAKEFKGSNYIPGDQRTEFKFARVDGKAFLVPLPEGEFQRVEQFARGLMAKLVPAEMLPESSKELVDLAKLFNNPEVAYAELGKMVKGKSDVQFARASAGAFDFGMREVQNGKLIRPGKPPLGTKDGWMTELEFRVNGGDLGPLQKDEVAFYKQLVPEAFANEKVHLQKLWDGLGKVGEQVKVVTYGQDGNSTKAKQELDQLTHDWYDATSNSDELVRRVWNGASDETLASLGYSSQDISKARRYFELKQQVSYEGADTSPRATSYYNQISPFDTKKFPVLRVDVVLPIGELKGNETSAQLNAAGDARKPLWRPDNLHENLPNTLGWAMVQIVPHPVTGEKVMFVGEAQSRWAQTVRKRGADNGYTLRKTGDTWEVYDRAAELVVWSGKDQAEATRNLTEFRDSLEPELKAPESHPLLPIHQNLILKAVIKEAQKQGISKVAVSDGETAMMTEGHDTTPITPVAGISKAQQGDYKVGDWALQTGSSVRYYPSKEIAMDSQSKYFKDATLRQLTEYDMVPRVAQEGGMRLAYDTTMPSIMSKLVGEGKMEDFGPHKNQVGASQEQNQAQNGTPDTPQARQNLTSAGYRIDGDGSVFNTQGDYVGSFYEGELIDSTAAVARAAAGLSLADSNKGSPVFRNPDGTPKTNATARVYDISNPSPRIDTLFAQNQGRVYGAASYKAKQILINSKAFQGLKASDRAAFVFAHEQSHISFAKALEGKYGSQAKIQAEQALAWVNAANPQAKKNVEDVLKELHLGKDLAQMDGIRDVLNNPDSQEWLANVMGMYAVGAVKSKAPKQAFAMLPKPLREFMEWMVRHFQNLVKGAQTWMKLSGGDYQGAKNVKELFDSIRRSYRQAEWDAAQAERFLDIQPSSMIERGNEYAFAQSGDKLEQVGNEPVKDFRTFKKFVGSAWNKTIQPMHTLANTHEEFIEPVMAVMNSHSDTANSIADVFKIVVGEYDGSAKLRMTNQAFKRVYSSEPLVKLLNAIQIRAEVAGRRMITVDPMTGKEIFDMQALSPELRGRLQQFQPEAQQALVTMVAQAERANKLSQDKFLEADWQGVVHDFATLLSTKNSFNKADFKKAQEMAKGVFDDLKKANETTDQFQQDQLMQQAVSKLVTLDQVDQLKAMEQAQELFARFADLKDFYDKRPTFMSFRRFGNIKQRIKKGLQEDVIDAESNADLVEKLKFYKAQGWDEFGPRQEVDKKYRGQYRLDDKLLSLMQQRERLFKEMIENSSLGKDEKLAILSSKTASEALISEINSTEMYRPTKARTLSGDLDRFDWWEQFQNYTPRAIAAAQRRALGAKVNYWMQNPALVDLKSQKDQFMALYEQSKEPDPTWARKLSKLNAVWHIGWNLPGHMAEVFQPMMSGVHELVAKGESLPGAMKMFWKAEKETMKMHGYGLKDKFFNPDKAKIVVNGEEFEGMPAIWLKANGTSKENVDIARMLHAKRDRIQKAPLSELRDFTGEEHAKLEDVLGGKKQRTLGEIISSPFTMYANAAMNFYSNFTRHNGVVSMVTAYRKFRKDGLSHEEAMQKAELFDLTINNSSGRLERPEMFGKLGAAGHLVYGLTSYVRGRFSQLATYYRHGFDAGQFEGKLSPSEIKSARKAFQTMILAQVGAAGVLGLPFIGAGIALMEDLLDEDIKGKMITALDDVTNDPTLTRVFTHGMMSTLAESLGVPADLHSRFALSSFLGTNSYDGISAKSFMGPSVAMLSSMFNLAGEVAKGESMEKALTVAGPGGVKRLAEALSEDYQRDNPESNLMMSMLGFRSSQQVKRKEWEQITRKQELETRKQLTESATKVSDAMALGPREARIKLLQEADKLIPLGLDYQAVTKQRQQNVKDLIAKVSEIEANKVGPQDVRKEISGRLAPVASQTAQAMGVEMSNPIELARALAKQKTRSQLGATSSQRPVRNAMLQDMQWGNDPWSF